MNTWFSKHQTVLLSISALFLASILIGPSIVASQNLSITISIEKTVFLEGETVPVNVQCRNMGKQDLRLNPPVLGSANFFFHISDQRGVIYSYEGMFIPSSAIGTDLLGAGETKDFVIQIDREYGRRDQEQRMLAFFPTNIYTVQAFYVLGLGKQDTIVSNSLRFEVIEPKGSESRALEFLMMGLRDYWKFGSKYGGCVSELRHVIEGFPESVYRLEAIQTLTKAHQMHGDSTSAIRMAKLGLEAYPNSLLARDLIGPIIFNMSLEGKLSFLTEWASKYPDTKIQSYCQMQMKDIRNRINNSNK